MCGSHQIRNNIGPCGVDAMPALRLRFRLFCLSSTKSARFIARTAIWAITQESSHGQAAAETYLPDSVIKSRIPLPIADAAHPGCKREDRTSNVYIPKPA